MCKSRSREVLMPPPRVAAIARQALCAAAAISRCGLTPVDARLAQLEAPAKILGWNSFLFGDGTSKYGVPNTTELLGPSQLLDGFKQNLMPAGYSVQTWPTAANLANESGNGFFLDLDLLPFGMEMGFPPNEPPWTPGRGMPFWQPVRRTIVSLWAIASSPLQYSGDVRSGSVDAQGNRYWTKELSALLTNPDVIAAHQNVRAGRQVSASNSTIIWVSGCAAAPTTTNEKEAPLISVCHYVVAVFNVVWYGEPRKADSPCPRPPWGNTTHRTSAQLAEQLGINTAEQLQGTDLWNRTRDYVLPVGAKMLVAETAHLDVTFLKIASGAKHAPTKNSTAMFKSDDGEYDNNGPGLSIGTAFKGCQNPCWLNDRSQNKTTQNLWPFQVEITVFEHDCKAPTGCKLSHAWTGGTWPGYHNSRLRYYVDLEPNASVDFPLGLGAGSSMLEDVSTAPFSAGDLFGWTGLRAKGGIFNTYQIPFVKSVRVTVELLTTQATGQRQHDPVGFWLILRGTEGGSDGSAARLPGGVLLPKSARLRTFENSARVVAGGSTLDLLRSTAERQQIAMLMVSLAVSSNHTGLSFLEGCFRAYSGKNSALQLLSSGTEDFFLGTFYFESGKFANSLAGATRLNSTNGVPVCTWRGTPSGEPTCSSPTGASFSAYRVLGGVDPLVLATPATISWRNGDSAGCDLARPGGSYDVAVSSVVFFYEYTLNHASPTQSLKSDDAVDAFRVWKTDDNPVDSTVQDTLPFTGSFFDGAARSRNGSAYLLLLDQARRMLAPADTEFQTISGVFDPDNLGLVEGAQWNGAIWTQNTYGFGLTAAALLPQPALQWLQTSYLWWFDHRGDGGQVYMDSLPDVPAGMLCDAGSPTGCQYKQCGPGSRKRSLLMTRKLAAKSRDTSGPGHDWIIEGTLAGVIQQAELLLATRNVTGARAFMPIFKEVSDFMETRRVQRNSVLTGGGGAGLFYANSGANLLAPAYGGQGLPRGCLVNVSCGTPGFPVCCTNRGYAMLTGLTVTYTAVLDRMIALEEFAYPAGRNCTRPNSQTVQLWGCVELFRARRAANIASLAAVTDKIVRTNTSYLLKALAPDGERYGVVDDAFLLDRTCIDKNSSGWLHSSFSCPPQTRHGYFETSPNLDAIALRVTSQTLADELYASVQAVKGLRPCDWTVSNFPDYDDSGYSNNGREGCREQVGCFGWFVSGVTYGTLEARAVMAHLRMRRFDLASASMGRLVYPFARLFKNDSPARAMGCGPGDYSEADSGRSAGTTTLSIDSFGIAAAFVRGLLDPVFGANILTLHPRLPPEVDFVTQRFPVRWGSGELFVTLRHGAALAVEINGSRCMECVGPTTTLPPTSTCKHHNDMSDRKFVIKHITMHSAAACCEACGRLTGCAAYTFVAAEPGCYLSDKTSYSEPDTRDITAGVCEHGACNASSCATCVSKPTIEPGAVRLNHTVSYDNAATAIVITLPAASNPEPSAAFTNGTAAQRAQRWKDDERERMAFDQTSMLPAACQPNATLLALAKNATVFRSAMDAAKLSGRFEFAQAGALLQALNASTTRCLGRLKGWIAPLPRQPTSWTEAGYDMVYNQSEVEATFDDNIGRTWRGLCNTVMTYDRANASPEEAQVLALFRGRGWAGTRAAQVASLNELETRIQRTYAELEALQARHKEVLSSLDSW